MRSSTFPHTKLPAPHTLTVWWTVDTDSASHSMILSLLLSLRQLICNWCKRRLELTHKATECNHQLLHAHTNTRGCKNLASGNPCNITLRTASSNCWCVRLLYWKNSISSKNKTDNSRVTGRVLTFLTRGDPSESTVNSLAATPWSMLFACSPRSPELFMKVPRARTTAARTCTHTHSIDRLSTSINQPSWCFTWSLYHLIVVLPDRCFTWSMFFWPGKGRYAAYLRK